MANKCCSGAALLVGLALGIAGGVYAERYSHTARGRKLRRDIRRTLREVYGYAEDKVDLAKDKAQIVVDKINDMRK